MENSGATTDTPATHRMLAELERLNDMCLALEQRLDALKKSGVQDQNIELLKDGFLSIRVGMIYYAEANRCIQSEAWFAATTVGAAALEAILLAKCLMQADGIRKLDKFRALPLAKRRDFGHFARQLDLGKLLDIADRLGWFPEGAFPSKLRSLMGLHLSDEEMTLLLRPFEGQNNIGKICADELKESRKLIHPSVCLKQRRMPSAAVGMAGTFLLMTLISLLTSQ